MNAKVFSLILILFIMVAAFFYAATFKYLQAKLAPMTLAGAVVILTAVKLVGELRKKRGAKAHTEEQGQVQNTKGPYVVEMAWMAGFLVVIYGLGFMIALPTYSAAYMKAHGAKWRVSIVTAMLITIAIWAIFSYFLDSELYSGLVFKQMGIGY